MGRSTKQIENETPNGRTMTEGMDNERVLTPGEYTKEEKRRYEELLAQTKSSLISLVTALKEIKDNGLYITVGEFADDDGMGWKLWLQKHCPIQPKLAQLYLTVADEFKDVTAVELVRDHSAEIQQIIKDRHEGNVSEIKFDRKRNKFVLHIVNEDEDGNEVISKIPVEDYIDKLVKEKLAKAQNLISGASSDSLTEEQKATQRINSLTATINKLRADILSQVGNIASNAVLLPEQDSLLSCVEDFLDGLDKARTIILSNFPGLRVTSRASVTDSEDNNGFPQKSEESAENFLQDHAHVIQVDHNNIPVNVELTPEQIQIVQDYNKKYLKCVRDYGNEIAGYQHDAGAVIYVDHFSTSEKENKPGEYDIYPLVYINGNVQIFEIDLKDLQENFEVITEVKEFKKARKMFAFVKE